MTDSAAQAWPALPSLRQDPGVVDVLVIGSFFCDLVFAGLTELPEPGDEVWAGSCSILPGGTYITAAAIHRFGVSSAWACRFGTDPFSRFVRDAASRDGLDPSAFVETDGPLRNISVAISFGLDRSFVSFAEPVEPIPLDVIERLRPRVIMWPGLGDLDDVERALAAARTVGAIVFVDPQSSKHGLSSERVRSLLKAVDVFAPNEREALLLTGATSLDAALPSLVESTGLVIVKRGPDGATAADHHGAVWAPGLPVEAIETTGAGDCFNAGFVMAMIEGSDIVGCLQAGNAAGALSTAAPSSAGIPSRTDVDRARANYGQRDGGTSRPSDRRRPNS